MTNETAIRKAVLVAVAKKYQKFNDKNPTGQEILDRTLVRYDPVSDEFHPNDTSWIDSQQAYYKLNSATLRIDPAAFDELCEGNAPEASNVLPMISANGRQNVHPKANIGLGADNHGLTISVEEKELLEQYMNSIDAILKTFAK